MKAMALRPADRYGSARALAEDVERWLADEPVQARREPAWERARRWMRRRRTLVAASAAALMAATVGLAAVLVVQTRANAALQSANLDLGLANQLTSNANRDLQLANTRERARFDLALEAIKTFHGGVSEELLLKERQFDGLRTRLLGGASDFYQRLEALLDGEADRHSRAALGQAYHDIGELTARIGSQAEALAALRRALDIRLALAAEAGFDAATRRDAAKSLIAIGELEQETGEFAGARPPTSGPATCWSPSSGRSPMIPRNGPRWPSASTGSPGSSTTWVVRADSLASHQRARTIFQELSEAHPTVAAFRSELAASYHDIGAIHRAGGQVEQALAAYRMALAIRRQLAEADPTAPQLQSDMAQSYNDLGFMQDETGLTAEALASLQQARAIFQGLADANPAVTQFEGELALSHQAIGTLQGQIGHPADAQASLDRAGSILQKLVAANPKHALFQSRLAMNHSYVGQARQRRGRPAEAASEFRQAIAIMEPLCELQPDGYSLYNLACFRSLLAGVADRADSGVSAAEAGALGGQAIDALRRAVAAGLGDLAFMRKDPDLDALRSRPDFRMLMMDLAFPDEPFVR